MGIREAMQRKVQRVVDPGEQVHACFPAAGHNPLQSHKPPQYIVAVTNRSIRIYASKWWRSSPKELIQVSPHQWLAEPSALAHAQIEIGGRPLWVEKKFHPDVGHANERMRLA